METVDVYLSIVFWVYPDLLPVVYPGFHVQIQNQWF